jgi:hypothetical protein
MDLKTRGYLKLVLGFLLAIASVGLFYSGGKDIGMAKLGETRLGQPMEVEK